MVTSKRKYSRYDEENQTVAEDEGNKVGPSGRREGKFPAREEEDDEVEGHGVNKRNREQTIVRRRNNASFAVYPVGFQQNT